MEEYTNNEKTKNKSSFSTVFKLDIVENSHYEFESYNDLLRKWKSILLIIIKDKYIGILLLNKILILGIFKQDSYLYIQID
jgi:hypothetical protein